MREFLKNFEKKNEKKLAKFLKVLLKIEMKRGSFTYLGEYVRVRFYSLTMNEL